MTDGIITKYYDPAVTLSDDQICELVRIATIAPTSFHMQNWRFIAVRTPEARARLRSIAWDKPPTLPRSEALFDASPYVVGTAIIYERKDKS